MLVSVVGGQSGDFPVSHATHVPLQSACHCPLSCFSRSSLVWSVCLSACLSHIPTAFHSFTLALPSPSCANCPTCPCCLSGIPWQGMPKEPSSLLIIFLYNLLLFPFSGNLTSNTVGFVYMENTLRCHTALVM